MFCGHVMFCSLNCFKGNIEGDRDHEHFPRVGRKLASPVVTPGSSLCLTATFVRVYEMSWTSVKRIRNWNVCVASDWQLDEANGDISNVEPFCVTLKKSGNLERIVWDREPPYRLQDWSCATRNTKTNWTTGAVEPEWLGQWGVNGDEIRGN